MSDLLKSRLIACKLAQWHRLQLDTAATPQLFRTLWKWFNGVPRCYAKEKANCQFQESIDMQRIKEELTSLEIKAKQLNSPVVFCHNDLLSGNIVYIDEAAALLNRTNCPSTPMDSLISSSEMDAGCKRVEFIDYEYGNYNYRGFDIANHFCEYAGFECDYSKYPSKEYQLKWLAVYLEELKKDEMSENVHSGYFPSKQELEALYKEVAVFSLASHFFWGLWALIQAQYSDINFDYMAYAILRFKNYENFKLKMEYEQIEADELDMS